MDFTDALGHDLHQETEDGGGDFDAVDEDSDEEYVPVAEPSAVPVSSGRSKVPQKAEKKENGEATEADPKKPSVQCPVCNKTFRSKYYLKVHNRYRVGVEDWSSAFGFDMFCIDLTLSGLQEAHRRKALCVQ